MEGWTLQLHGNWGTSDTDVDRYQTRLYLDELEGQVSGATIDWIREE